MEIKSSMMDDVKRKHLTWYGYVQGMEESRLPKQIMG